MPYEVSKIDNYYQHTAYVFNNVRLAFNKDNKINLNLSAPKLANVDKSECDIDEAEKYIDASIDIIGLICSCRLNDK